MKRTAIVRRTPLRSTSRLSSSKPLARHTKLVPLNRRRLSKRRAVQFAEQAALCRALPCCSCGAPPPSDPSHLKTRGAGGLDRDCVPQCRACHDRMGAEGIRSFWKRVGVDPQRVLAHLRDIVARMTATPTSEAA